MKQCKLIAILMVLFLMLIFTNCIRPDRINNDSFYSDSGWDTMRIPLLKPYEMLKLNQKLEINRKLGWSIRLHVPPSEKELYYYLDIHDIRKIAIENQVIMVYAAYAQEVDTDAGQKVLYWFVIIPDEKIETGFATEAEFLAYVHKLKINTPSWIDPNVAYEEFSKTNCLNWIPDCK